MLKNISDIKDIHHTLLAFLSTRGTLAGISLTLVGIVNIKTQISKPWPMICFFYRRWNNIIDFIFLASLTLLLVAGSMVLYEFM
jgi:hypothetical protein